MMQIEGTISSVVGVPQHMSAINNTKESHSQSKIESRSRVSEKKYATPRDSERGVSTDGMIKKLKQLLYDEKLRNTQQYKTLREHNEKHLGAERRRGLDFERKNMQLSSEIKELRSSFTQLEQNYNKTLKELSKAKEENSKLSSQQTKKNA